MKLNEGTRKRTRRVTTSSSVAGDPDRLSALPDCLLHTIMSFMKARQVVQTCVLSTRWRHLWRSVTCLDIDSDEFVLAAHSDPHYDNDDDDSDSDATKEREAFGDFAVNLMLRRSIAVLDSFRLRAPSPRVREAGDWIRRAMKYCAPDPFIQREGLSSGSWCLKRLHLRNVVLDDRFAKHVSSACHSLEDLELRGCQCRNIHSITSHSLKNLLLKNCSWAKLLEITSPTLKTLVINGGLRAFSCLVIVAPAVGYLLLDVNAYSIDISKMEMPFLTKASIHLDNCRYNAESKVQAVQFNILHGASNARSLELSGFGIMKLGKESTPQEFKNLRTLLLDKCDLTDDFQLLAFFLRSSPNLEKLTLQHCKFFVAAKPASLQDLITQNSNKPTSSQLQNLDVQCENLKLTEIVYKDDDVRQLAELLLHISGKLPKNYIKLTKVD